ncbi:MAG: hypothetical protein ABSB52_10905 [Acidimicrobiales bacterium]
MTRLSGLLDPAAFVPMAMLNPEPSNITTSLSLFPVVAISLEAMPNLAERDLSTDPLLSSGWVTVELLVHDVLCLRGRVVVFALADDLATRQKLTRRRRPKAGRT